MLKNKDYIPNIIEFFGLDLRLYGNKMIGCCPVHKGDNKTAFNLWPRSGFWVCRSHNCHEVFDKTFDGFLKGLYAANYKNWDGGASIDISDKEIDTFYNQIIKGNAPTPISIQPTIIKKTKQFKQSDIRGVLYLNSVKNVLAIITQIRCAENFLKENGNLIQVFIQIIIFLTILM